MAVRERAEQVHAAVVLVGGAEQDLAEAAAHRGAHPGPAGQGRVEGGHAPVEAPGGRLEGGRQRRAQHDGVGATGDGLGDVAALGHPAVGDDVHVDARLVEVAHAGAGHVGDGGGLGHAQASTPRVVHALPGPTPTSTPTAPVRIRCRPAW